LRVSPVALSTQALYLEGAHRVADRMDPRPEWVDQILKDWEATLDALSRMDRTWLAARLDAFTKYELFSAVLADAGYDWHDVPQRSDLFWELALLNQNYHEFTNPDSMFDQLEAAGALKHRVVPRVEPGNEPEPFVPKTGTRAEARARFIKAHQNVPGLAMSWTEARDLIRNRYRAIGTPFATQFGPWEAIMEHSENDYFQVVHAVRNRLSRDYKEGRFDSLTRYIMENDLLPQGIEADNAASDLYRTVSRYYALAHPRLGYADGANILVPRQANRRDTWQLVADHCEIIRYTGLCPDLEKMRPWIENAQAMFCSSAPYIETPLEALVIREHAATVLTSAGQLDEARHLLEIPRVQRLCLRDQPRLHARFIAVQGEIDRKSGDLKRASRRLHAAYRYQVANRCHGQLINYTLPALAKCATSRNDALAWLSSAAIMLGSASEAPVDALRIALLRYRVAGPTASDTDIDNDFELIRRRRDELPTLRHCAVLDRIITHWKAWVAGEMLAGQDDPFWGL